MSYINRKILFLYTVKDLDLLLSFNMRLNLNLTNFAFPDINMTSLIQFVNQAFSNILSFFKPVLRLALSK